MTVAQPDSLDVAEMMQTLGLVRSGPLIEISSEPPPPTMQLSPLDSMIASLSALPSTRSLPAVPVIVRLPVTSVVSARSAHAAGLRSFGGIGLEV